MNKTTISRHIGGMATLALLFFSNAAFADDSENRLNAYKGNKLIPHEVNIATVNAVSSQSTSIAVFTPAALSWKSYDNLQDVLFGKFMDWTREDFEAFFADSANEAEFEDAWKFLSQTGNDHLQGAAISDEDAMAVLQAQFNALVENYEISGKAFPCEGLDMSNMNICTMDFSKCTGLTWEQVISANDYTWITLPAMDFSGVNISGYDLTGINFANCTGLSWEQLSSAQWIRKSTLPNIDLSNAVMSGMALDGVDFSNCTGLTWEQLASASDITYAVLPALNLSSVNLTGKDMEGIDFSKCTGLTWGQLASASDMTYTTLPVMNLSGVDTTGKDLSGVDFSNCTELTTEHLSNASNINRIIISSSQYETMKADLSGTYISIGSGRYQKIR